MKYLLPLLLTVNFAQASPAIENGSLATSILMEKSGVVSIIEDIDGKEVSVCTGVRIAPKYILTANHCLGWNDLPKGIRQAINPGDQNVKLEKVIAAKFPWKDYMFEWQFGSLNLDIAILELETESDKPHVLLANWQDYLGRQNTIWQFGYGDLAEESDELNVPLQFLNNGSLQASSNVNIFDIFNPDSGILSGDSGGPVLVEDGTKFYLLGVVNTSGYVGKGIETSYQNSSYFIQWLRAALKDPDFNAHLIVPAEQHPAEGSEFLARKDAGKQFIRWCSELDTRLGSSWKIDGNGWCLPDDKETCLKLDSGLNGHRFLVSWNEEKKKCEML